MPPRQRDNVSFEEHVADALARIETRLDGLGSLPDRVTVLEAHRSYLCGAMAVLTALAGYMRWH